MIKKGSKTALTSSKQRKAMVFRIKMNDLQILKAKKIILQHFLRGSTPGSFFLGNFPLSENDLSLLSDFGARFWHVGIFFCFMLKSVVFLPFFPIFNCFLIIFWRKNDKKSEKKWKKVVKFQKKCTKRVRTVNFVFKKTSILSN